MAVARRGGDPSAPTNGVAFTRDELAAVVDDILARPDPDDRRSLDGLEDKRVDIIVAGALLLEQILDGLAIESMTMSEAALREGVLLDMAMRNGEPSFRHLSDIRRQSVLRMAEVFHEDIAHIETATDLALSLFDALEKVHGLDLADPRPARGRSPAAQRRALHLPRRAPQALVLRHPPQRSARRVHRPRDRAHRAGRPLSPQERAEELPRRVHGAVAPTTRRSVRTLAGMLRIAIALDRTRQGGVTALTADRRRRVRRHPRRGRARIRVLARGVHGDRTARPARTGPRSRRCVSTSTTPPSSCDRPRSSISAPATPPAR